MGNRLSMSRVWLAYLCAYFARVDVVYAETPGGRPARVGSLTHLLTQVKVGREGAVANDVDLSELAEAKALMDGPYGGWLDKYQWEASEIGFRYDAENDVAERGPRRGEPGYDEHGSMVLKGTLDLVKWFDAETLDVIDVKTGKKVEDRSQLYSQAVAASRHYKPRRVRVGYVYPRKTKCAEPDMEELDADRLDAEAGRIRRVLKAIPDAEPTPGQHCFRCPARSVCPEQQAQPYPDPPRAEWAEDARLF